MELKEIFKQDFELIRSGFGKGCDNMKFDESRIYSIIEDNSPAMFRLYGWNPPAVSLGFNQKESDINIEKCCEYNIDIVRRPTGGRAVLHYDELTYSIALSLKSLSRILEISIRNRIYQFLALQVLRGMK